MPPISVERTVWMAMSWAFPIMATSVAVALGAVVLAAGAAGCTAPADVLGTHTAQVTIDGIGEAQASFENGTFLITGTASGSAADQPTEETPHSFTIQTNC